jgi:hypothetical protein
MSKKNVLPVLIVLVSLIASLTGCKKENESGLISVSFQIGNVTNEGGFKNISSDTIICLPFSANYVKVWLDNSNTPVKVNVSYITGSNGDPVMISQSINFTVGNHILNKFVVYYDNNTPANEIDDVILSAAPMTNSLYSSYVQHPLPYYFNVTANQNNQAMPIGVEVVCYKPQLSGNFGSSYFVVNEIIIREMNFAGIFCMTKKSKYVNSPYAQQAGYSISQNEFYNANAISKIEVWKKRNSEINFTLVSTYSNTQQGGNIKVNYSDYIGTTEQFELRLYTLVLNGNTFVYRPINIWSFTDDKPFGEVGGKPYEIVGLNGGKTVCYTIGNCVAPNGTYMFPQIQNIPIQGAYTIWGNTYPGSLGSAYNAAISGIFPESYDIVNGIYPGYSIDLSNLYAGQSIAVKFYSSLYLNLIPSGALANNSIQLTKVNWLINHIGLSGTNNMFPGYLWSDLDGAIKLLNPNIPSIPSQTAMMNSMVNYTNQNYQGYIVPTGGWTSVLMVPDSGPSGLKILFLKE